MLHYVRMDHFDFIGQLPLAVLCALRLDGEILNQTTLFDTTIEWPRRCNYILENELHPLVLTGLSAAWAFGLSEEPRKHTASTITNKRIKIARKNFLKVEQRTLTDGDFWLKGDNGVTTPLRTLLDLLRTQRKDEGLQGTCTNIMANFNITVEEILYELDKRKSLPFKKQAKDRVLHMKLAL
jgi:hypothetical protein